MRVSIQRYTRPTPPPLANARIASRSLPRLMAAVTPHPSTTAAPVTASMRTLSAPYSLRPSARISMRCSGVSFTNADGRSSTASRTFSPHGKETGAAPCDATYFGGSSGNSSSALSSTVSTITSTSSRNQSPPCSGATQIATGTPMSGASKKHSSAPPRSSRGCEYRDGGFPTLVSAGRSG